jgi:hypothetical protein
VIYDAEAAQPYRGPAGYCPEHSEKEIGTENRPAGNAGLTLVPVVFFGLDRAGVAVIFQGGQGVGAG